MNVAELIYLSRTAKRKSQRELGEAIGVSHAKIAYMEKGDNKHGEPVKDLTAICWELNIPVKKMASAIRQTEKERGVKKGEAKAESFIKYVYEKEKEK